MATVLSRNSRSAVGFGLLGVKSCELHFGVGIGGQRFSFLVDSLRLDFGKS